MNCQCKNCFVTFESVSFRGPQFDLVGYATLTLDNTDGNTRTHDLVLNVIGENLVRIRNFLFLRFNLRKSCLSKIVIVYNHAYLNIRFLSHNIFPFRKQSSCFATFWTLLLSFSRATGLYQQRDSLRICNDKRPVLLGTATGLSNRCLEIEEARK